ncbi:hypothetical protein GDO81_023820 [Engystomops pustulosus]|uniref:Uncharacterized protein n=1 Tax=Engystomops pustulosus TaxID=76066 RepID=A0AAV6ZBU8_ENGPU|nr:hypothetical protein GDO81_023820 [Engystomops pustulosus]
MAGVRVAVVTGGNKGLGLAIVRALCKQFQGDVYLTARNPKLGEEAVKTLNNEGLSPLFHQLDITDLTGIRTLRDFIKEKYGGLDVLVNNAGIAFRVCGRPKIAMDAMLPASRRERGDAGPRRDREPRADIGTPRQHDPDTGG